MLGKPDKCSGLKFYDVISHIEERSDEDYVDNGQPGCRPVMGRRLYSVQCVQHHLMCTTSSHISHLVDLNTPARPSRAMPVLSTI